MMWRGCSTPCSGAPWTCNSRALASQARFLGDLNLMLAPALQGLGLVDVFEDMVKEQLERGQLLQVLGDWCHYYPGALMAVFAERAFTA